MKSFFYDYFDSIDNERFSILCFIIYKRENSFISIYCIQLKGFTLSWMGFILSWHSIRYRSDSFYHSNKPNELNHFFMIILIKLIKRGSVYCALLSIKERTHFISIYCIQLKGFTLSWTGFILSWYSIRYRSDSFYHSNNLMDDIMFLIILIKLIKRGSV